MSTPLPVLVVPDPRHSPQCLAVAAEEALRRGCELVAIVNSVGTSRRPHDECLVENLRSSFPTVQVSMRAGPLSPHGLGERASLVVTGPALARLWVADSDVDVPVLVHREPDGVFRPPALPVLVGLGPDTTTDTIDVAFAEGQLRATSVRAVYVPARLDEPTDPELEHWLRDTLDRWSEKYHVPMQLDFRYGLDAAVAVTVASRRACLVVVGADPAGGASVVRTLVNRAGCPVLVVPAAWAAPDPSAPQPGTFGTVGP